MAKSKVIAALANVVASAPVAPVALSSNLVTTVGLRAGQRGAIIGAPAQPVSTRRHGTVVTVALAGAAYRVAAPHCQQWYAAISKACAAGPASVATLQAEDGVPGHFIAYILNKGILVANPA